MGAVESAADVCGAKQGRITVIATATSSTSTDMWAQFPALGEQIGKFFVKITCDQTCYFFWTDTAGQTVDETTAGAASASGSMCDVIAAGAPEQHRVSGRYLVHKTPAGVGSLRVTISQGIPELGYLPRIP